MTGTPIEIILDAYRRGQFPMAQMRDSDEVYLFDPPMRGQLSITDLHIPKKLKKQVLAAPYDIRIDTDFAGVIDGCALESDGREETWINDTIRTLFIMLHEAWHAHSVECWKGGELVGGLYGLALGGAFCGESMFSRADNASKIALVHLCARLYAGGFQILDTQYTNPHLEQFGVYEITREDYLEKLAKALTINADFKLSTQKENELIKNYFLMRDQ